jgi:hypothetical protein
VTHARKQGDRAFSALHSRYTVRLKMLLRPARGKLASSLPIMCRAGTKRVKY